MSILPIDKGRLGWYRKQILRKRAPKACPRCGTIIVGDVLLDLPGCHYCGLHLDDSEKVQTPLGMITVMDRDHLVARLPYYSLGAIHTLFSRSLKPSERGPRSVVFTLHSHGVWHPIHLIAGPLSTFYTNPSRD